MWNWIDLKAAVTQPWTRNYIRLLAVILVYGALVHVGNMLGMTGTPWPETPGLWRVMDVVLLVFNVVVAIGLWTRVPWSVAAYVTGVLVLQVVPYTVFRTHFISAPADGATLNGLLGTHAVLLAVLLALIIGRK